MSEKLRGGALPRQPMNEERWQLFIDALIDCGSIIEAARRASPHSTDSTGKGCYSTFRKEWTEKPELRQQVDEAIAECNRRRLKKLESAVYERALNGTTETMLTKHGEVEVVRYDVRRELATLKRLETGSWVDRKEVKHEGDAAAVNVNLDFRKLVGGMTREERAALHVLTSERPGEGDTE